MSTGLNVNRVVNVEVILSPLAVPRRNFGIPLFVGASEVIDVAERIREYASIDEVGDDFLTTSDEYKAAQKFFAQSPQPDLAYIGRWAQSATKAILYGGVLLPEDQLLTNFTAITTGAMFIFVDGVPKSITGINMANQTTLNGCAAVVQTALQSAVASTAFTWLAKNSRFKLEGASSGATASYSWAKAPTAWASVAFSKQPANNDVLTIAGTAVKFVTGTPGANEVLIGDDLAHTLANLLTVCGQSTDVNLLTCVYYVTGTTFYIVAAAPGTAGNDITLVETTDSGNAMTLGNLTGGKLTGGAGQDISGIFKLSSANGAATPVAGITAETPVACAQLLADQSHQWYGIDFVTTTQPSLIEHEAVAEFIEAASPSRTYWWTSRDSTILDAQTEADLGSSMKTMQLARTAGIYSAANWLNAAASLFGRIATIDFAQSKSTLTMKFKRLPGITPDHLTETQATTLRNKNVNCYVFYDNDRAIVQEGVMADGSFIDERINCDWFQNALQVELFNVLYQTPTKIPQTDAGTAILVAACKKVCEQSVNNGMVAPGLWNGAPFGQLDTGDTLTTGYYIYPQPVSSQSQADREARHAVPIQIGLKMAGAVHDVHVTAWVNR